MIWVSIILLFSIHVQGSRSTLCPLSPSSMYIKLGWVPARGPRVDCDTVWPFLSSCVDSGTGLWGSPCPCGGRLCEFFSASSWDSVLPIIPENCGGQRVQSSGEGRGTAQMAVEGDQGQPYWGFPPFPAELPCTKWGKAEGARGRKFALIGQHPWLQT